jgi:hypothetical protein
MRHQQQPVPPHRFGLLPVRSPLLREYSLFLEVLRCFSSPGSLHRAYVFSTGSSSITRMGLPHSDTLGSLPARGSPRHFAAWPRPSSAPDAKASTVCPSRESACCHWSQRTSTPQRILFSTSYVFQHQHTHTTTRSPSQCLPLAFDVITADSPCSPRSDQDHVPTTTDATTSSLRSRLAHPLVSPRRTHQTSQMRVPRCSCLTRLRVSRLLRLQQKKTPGLPCRRWQRCVSPCQLKCSSYVAEIQRFGKTDLMLLERIVQPLRPPEPVSDSILRRGGSCQSRPSSRSYDLHHQSG